MELRFRLKGTGWAQAQLTDRASTATITASYLNDALALLLEAVSAVFDGAQESRCSWAEEPGENRWILTRERVDVRLRVLGLPDAESREPDDHGTVIVETRLPARELATLVADAAQEALDRYGEHEYQRLWGHRFPTDQLGRISAQLADG